MGGGGCAGGAGGCAAPPGGGGAPAPGGGGTAPPGGGGKAPPGGGGKAPPGGGGTDVDKPRFEMAPCASIPLKASITRCLSSCETGRPLASWKVMRPRSRRYLSASPPARGAPGPPRPELPSFESAFAARSFAAAFALSMKPIRRLTPNVSYARSPMIRKRTQDKRANTRVAAIPARSAADRRARRGPYR